MKLTHRSLIVAEVAWLVFCLLGLLLLMGAVRSYGADTDFEFVKPATPFFMGATAPIEGAATGYQWQRQMSGGAFTAFGEGTGPTALRVTDTLANKTAARYQLRAWNSSWACDATGCHEIGDRAYGPWSTISSWEIATVMSGACGKPTKE